MCEKNVILSLILILKIIILAVIPIIIIVNKRIDSNKKNILFYVELGLITLLIVLRIMDNPCITNSNISGLKTNSIYSSSEHVSENNDPDTVNEIVTNKIYMNNKGGSVYYFNNNELPLSNKKIICDNKSVYMKNYGNAITAGAIGVSSALSTNIDPIKILNYLLESNMFNCDTGVGINEVLSAIKSHYNISYYDISQNELVSEIQNGNPIIVETKYVPGANNVTCSTGYLVVYNYDYNGKLHALNPNNMKKDYICPANSEGYLSVIKADTNSINWDLGELLSISTRFIKIVRN
ncbi:MAG: hypothetical protein IKF36_01525 [Bacilli bacterium]|nr:hypothetical protein [Bacilli bacterium]